MQTSACGDNRGRSRLGLSMNIWWAAAPSNWKRFGFILILNTILVSHMFAYQMCRHTRAIKKRVPENISSPLWQLRWCWLNKIHCSATDNNRSRESELTLKMITSNTHGRVRRISYAKTEKGLLEKSAFALCIKISHNMPSIRMCSGEQNSPTTYFRMIYSLKQRRKRRREERLLVRKFTAEKEWSVTQAPQRRVGVVRKQPWAGRTAGLHVEANVR